MYGRPQLKGRDLAKLAPADKVWRTGANEAAEITFYNDVMFYLLIDRGHNLYDFMVMAYVLPKQL